MTLLAFLKHQPPHYANSVMEYRQFMIIAVRRGRLFFEAEGRHTVIRPGSLAVLRHGSRFRLHTEGDGYEGVAIEVRPVSRADLFGPSGVIPSTPLLTALVEGLEERLTRPDPRHGATTRALAQAVLELGLVRLQTGDLAKSNVPSPDFWAEQVKATIESSLHTGRSIQDLLAGSELSYRQLARHFTRVTGESPKDFQMRCRLAEADHLLTQVGLSVTQVAMELGFPSSQHFSRIYRKRKGASPGQFRREDVRATRL